MTDYERTRVTETETDVHHAPHEPSVTTEREYVTHRQPLSVLLRRIVALLFGILQALLVLRIILLLLVANPDNDVVRFILGATDPFVEPFRGMFRLDRVTGEQGSVLDIAAVLALIGWTLVELLALAIVGLADRRSTVD